MSLTGERPEPLLKLLLGQVALLVGERSPACKSLQYGLETKVPQAERLAVNSPKPVNKRKSQHKAAVPAWLLSHRTALLSPAAAVIWGRLLGAASLGSPVQFC